MADTIRVYIRSDYDRAFLPIPASTEREWFGEDAETRCRVPDPLPLMEANGCGYYILSPARFTVTWDGNPNHDASIVIHEKASHGVVDAHAAYGSFVVQGRILAKTENIGDFLWIKGIPNAPELPFTCMEALIESWWSNAQFGLVFLLNGPGTFLIEMGQPIAQMLLFKAAGGFAELEIDEAPLE